MTDPLKPSKLTDEEARSLLLVTPQLSCVCHPDGRLRWAHPHWNQWRAASGDWRWLAWSARRGDADTLFAVARDITTQTRRDVALQTRLQQLEMAEDIALVGSWRFDLAQQRVSWSPKVFEIHGRDPALGDPTVEEAIAAYHPDDQARVRAVLDHTIETGEPYDFVLRLIRDDGAVRTVESQGRVERGPLGAVRAVIGVFQDVTHRAALQQQIEHTQRLAAIGELAGGVAHEVNNPLTYVGFNAEGLIDELMSLEDRISSARRDTMMEMARDIQQGVKRIAAIVDSMRAFTPDARPLATCPLQVDGVVARAIREGDPAWRDPARVRVELPDGLPAVQAHPDRLSAALTHLLRNAAQATRPGDGPTRIRAERDGDTLLLQVCDAGEGMPDDVLQRAEEPFYSTRKPDHATGLGLFVTHAFARAMGGTLRLTSTPGAGTTATLALQIVPQRADPPGPSAPRSVRVLLIDDEPRVLRAAARALSDHEVSPFERAADALDHLRIDADYDVVIADIGLPDVRNGAFLQALPPRLQARTWLLAGGALRPADETIGGQPRRAAAGQARRSRRAARRDPRELVRARPVGPANQGQRIRGAPADAGAPLALGWRPAPAARPHRHSPRPRAARAAGDRRDRAARRRRPSHGRAARWPPARPPEGATRPRRARPGRSSPGRRGCRAVPRPSGPRRARWPTARRRLRPAAPPPPTP